MKYWRFVLFLPFLFLNCHSKNYPAGKVAANKWLPLFNGKNLDGWLPKIAGLPLGTNYANTFRVRDGILSTRYDQYDSFNNKFGALYFEKKFTNYRLKFEYRFVGNTAPGAPSWGFRDGGVQYHCQAPSTIGLDQPFPVCLEFNLHGGDGTKDRPTGEICASGIYILIDGKRNSSYCTPPLVKRTIHGDEWVTAEIEVKNEIVTQYVNGEEVIRFTNPRYDPAHALGRQFIVDGNDKVTSGYISIQSNSHPMDFRKIEIMEF